MFKMKGKDRYLIWPCVQLLTDLVRTNDGKGRPRISELTGELDLGRSLRRGKAQRFCLISKREAIPASIESSQRLMLIVNYQNFL